MARGGGTNSTGRNPRETADPVRGPRVKDDPVREREKALGSDSTVGVATGRNAEMVIGPPVGTEKGMSRGEIIETRVSATESQTLSDSSTAFRVVEVSLSSTMDRGLRNPCAAGGPVVGGASGICVSGRERGRARLARRDDRESPLMRRHRARGSSRGLP